MMIAGSQGVALAGPLHAGIFISNQGSVSAAITTNVFPLAFGFRPWRLQAGIGVNPGHFRREWNSIQRRGILLSTAPGASTAPTPLPVPVASAATR